MNSYSEYKPTNVKGVDEIPVQWTPMRFRHLFSIGRGLGITKENLQETGIPCVNYGEIHSKYGFELDIEKHPLKCVSEEYINSSPNSLLNKGDLVFADTSEDLEGSGNFTQLVSDDTTFAGYHTVIARQLKNHDNRFLAYALDSEYYRNQVRRAVKGVKVFSITQAILKDTSVLLPSIEEQKAISSYLDVNTDRIDSLIYEKQNFIKLLQEKRQALISHVVTKGLNPNVPMKDSGVEWIGEIPEHWVAKKLKYCLSIKNGQDYKEVETENIEGSYPVYGSGGEFRRATDYLYDGESVLLGRKGTIDKPMYVNEKFWTVDTMFYSKIHNNSDGKFLYYLATTLPFDFYQTKTALPSMTQGDLLNHPVAVPDKLEQIKIREYIDTQCEIFDELKAEVLKSVELLKEHRTALISAAVTGKIDVREVA